MVGSLKSKSRLARALAAIGRRRTYTYLANHDQGSAAAIDATDPANVRITPHISDYGKWGWYCVRHPNLAGTTPHFLIAKADHFSLAAGMWAACWASAADTDTWYLFDNLTIGATDIEFYNDSAFPAGTIYIAALPMYPWSRVQRKVTEWLADAYVSDAASETDGVIGLSTSRALGDGSGRVIPALPFYGFKLANPTAGTKNKIILTTLSHATETPGAYAFEAAIDYLLGGSVLAEFLLDYCEFYIYPATNPQGVWGGWFRSSPEVPGTSHDWLWDVASAGQDESVDAYKAAMTADTGGTIEVGFDYHAYYGNTDIHGAVHTGDVAGNYAAFLAEMAALDGDFNLLEQDLSKASAVFFKSLSASIGLTVEQGLETARGVAEWQTYGQQTMQALARMLSKGYFTNNPGVGARDFGATNRLDRTSPADLKDHALSISLWVKLDTITANGYLFCIHQAGDGAVAMYFNASHTTADYVSFGVLGTGNMQRASDANNPTTGAWIHYLVTWDGVITNATGVHIYKNGVEVPEYSITTNGSGSVSATGKWSLGGRIPDDLRNMDGKQAQLRVFNRVLSQAERDLEAAGILTTTSGLVSWLKANTDDLHDAVDNVLWTADGTMQLTGVGTGPAIIYG
jgi:hypothetical protein